MRILLIAEKFSPNNSVGARRWSKFYKYLKLNNIDITVITQQHKTQSNTWGLDTTNDKAIVRINTLINPFQKLKLIQKVINIGRSLLFYKILKFTDNGYWFNLKAYRKATKIIVEKKITHIIATSPSNSTAYFSAKLKIKFPNIILIQDFRDAWMQAYDTYNTGYNELHYMYKKEMKMESFSAKNADIILSVAPEIVEYFKEFNTNSLLLTNGFDTDDYPSKPVINPEKILMKEKINICHFGTLDFGRETECLIFIEELLKDRDFFEHIQFTFIGNTHNNLINKLKKYTNIAFIDTLDKVELKKVMYHAHFHLAVNDKILYYAYGSKLFDAFLYKKPVIFVTKPQFMSNFIESNAIGLAVDTENMDIVKIKHKILNLLKKAEENNFEENYSKDVEQFDLTYLTKKLIDVIHSKNNI